MFYILINSLKHQHWIKLVYVFLIGFIFPYIYFSIRGYAPAQPLASCSNCNIILVVTSPLRQDVSACNNQTKNFTPHLCALAKNSIILENLYAPMSRNLPNIMSLLTSVPPMIHQTWTPSDETPISDLITLPEVLKKRGYKTVYIGPTLNGAIRLDKRLSQGFEENIQATSVSEWPDLLKKVLTNKKNQKPYFILLYGTSLKSSWLETTKKIAENPTPSTEAMEVRSFGNLLLDTVNKTIQDFSDTSDNMLRIAKLLADPDNEENPYTLLQQLTKTEQDIIIKQKEFAALGNSSQSILAYLLEDYRMQVQSLDARLQPFLLELKALQATGKTIFIITTGHGEEFGEHGALGHGTNLYATVTHVPLILSIPTLKPHSQQALMQTIDIYPTLLDAVGIPIPSQTMGISMLPVLQGIPDAPRNEYAFGQLDRHHTVHSIRDSKWSYYWNQSADGYTEELFDLQADPGEQTNVVEAHPAQANVLFNQLNRTYQYIKRKLPLSTDR